MDVDNTMPEPSAAADRIARDVALGHEGIRYYYSADGEKKEWHPIDVEPKFPLNPGWVIALDGGPHTPSQIQRMLDEAARNGADKSGAEGPDATLD